MAYKFDKTVLGAAAYGGLVSAVWFDQGLIGLAGSGLFYSFVRRWGPEAVARLGLTYGLFLGVMTTYLAIQQVIPGNPLYWAAGTPLGLCLGGLLVDILEDLTLRLDRRSGRRARMMAPKKKLEDDTPRKKAWSNRLLKKTLAAKEVVVETKAPPEPEAPTQAPEEEAAIQPIGEAIPVEAPKMTLDGPVSDEDVENLMDRARIGDLGACHQLGRIFELSEDDRHSIRKAFDWYRKGAREGDPDCCVALARFYEEGISVAADDAEACYWFLLAAEKLPSARHGVQRIAGRLPHATLSRVRKRVKSY